jgi:hypothetical protein
MSPSLRARGLTILLVDQNVGVAASVADEAHVLAGRRGRVLHSRARADRKPGGAGLLSRPLSRKRHRRDRPDDRRTLEANAG